jgi:hypothetical protein
MQRTTLRVAGFISILFGIFWIIITTLGFIHLLTDGQSSAVQNETVVSLCDMFFKIWYNPALLICNFSSAPSGTAEVFWCVATLVVMVIFLISGIKLIKYSNEDYDLKENVSKTVMFIIFTGIMLAFSIFGCAKALEIVAMMYVNIGVLVVMFILPIIECIKAAKD